MIEDCVLHLAGSQSPSRGSGWAAVLRTTSAKLVAEISGGEPGASAYRMQLVALLRGLERLPEGTARLCVRGPDQTLLGCCESYLLTGTFRRKARYKERMRELRPLLSSLEVEWVATNQTNRDEWDRRARKLARDSAVLDGAGLEETLSIAAQASFVANEAVEEALEETGPIAPPRLVVYADGGCRGNPGVGGWGFVLVDAPSHSALEQHGSERDTTNNRMEMTAAIRALEAIHVVGQSVEVRTDSQYLINVCSRWLPGWKAKGWRRKGKGPILNLDLVKRLDELQQRHDVRWKWVPGHAGVAGNEYVDGLANRAMDILGTGRSPEGQRRFKAGQSPVRVATPELVGSPAE